MITGIDRHGEQAFILQLAVELREIPSLGTHTHSAEPWFGGYLGTQEADRDGLRGIEFNQDRRHPENVWAVLADLDNYPQWHPSYHSVTGQLAKHKVATPVNWKQGEPVVIAGSVSNDQAKEIFGSWDAPKPYIRIVPQPS